MSPRRSSSSSAAPLTLPPPAPAMTLELVEASKRVQGRVTFDGSTLELDVYRVGPSGVRAYVRGFEARDVSAVTVADFSDLEVPFGVPVEYVAVARNGDGETPSTPQTITVESELDWLVDLDDVRNTGSVYVESLPQLDYDAPQGVHRVIGRRTPIVTSDIRWTPAGRLTLVTLEVEDARRVRDALGSSSPLLLRSTFERGVGNLYLLATRVAEVRTSPLAVEPSRRWLVDFVEIDRPAANLYVPVVVTWAEVLATFTDWQDVLDSRDDWGDLAVNRDGITGSEGFSLEPAFPPRDV